MSSITGNKPPIVEPSPTPEGPDLTLRALQQRIRQQEILSELGVIALQGASIDHLLAETARLAAEGLQVEFSKVLEYIPAENRLLVRAGVGWGPDVVGVASVGADLASPAGFALKTGKPVISNHLENEQRFRTSELLVEHGITRAINVILEGDGKPFGVLELDSRSEVDFTEHDIAFLQGAANIVGMGIERERYQRKLQAALERHQILLKEVNHRVKNSLSIIVSLFRLQAKEIGNPILTERLEEAAHPVQDFGGEERRQLLDAGPGSGKRFRRRCGGRGDFRVHRQPDFHVGQEADAQPFELQAVDVGIIGRLVRQAHVVARVGF